MIMWNSHTSAFTKCKNLMDQYIADERNVVDGWKNERRNRWVKICNIGMGWSRLVFLASLPSSFPYRKWEGECWLCCNHCLNARVRCAVDPLTGHCNDTRPLAITVDVDGIQQLSSKTKNNFEFQFQSNAYSHQLKNKKRKPRCCQ